MDDSSESSWQDIRIKPLRTRLEETRDKLGIPWEVLERDYLLSWVLAAMAQSPSLYNRVIFKGGTALKKCYFGDYRFSEDLDFSALASAPTGQSLETAMKEVCAHAVKLLDAYAPVEIVCERHLEKDPHPGRQEAFDLRAQFPWHRRPTTHVMVEISMDEKILTPHVPRAIIHGYEEPLDAKIATYSLEEIVAEKLRAILQHAQSLERRGWVRSRARDYYDLWRILDAYRDQLNTAGFAAFLGEKCAAKQVSFSGPGSFFPETMLSTVEKTWQDWLGILVPHLPPYHTVLSELRPQITRLLAEKIDDKIT